MEQRKLGGRSSKAKRYKVIACKVLARELYYCAWSSKNIIDIQLLEQQLHNTPDLLRTRVQAAIDAAEADSDGYDAILLAYGLCSNGVAGIKSDHTPLVIPRAHDCISLLLGSKERYRELFNANRGGIYWFSPGWMETCVMPGKEREDSLMRVYTEKFGEDNAEYLVEMERSWAKEYKAAYYVGWPNLENSQYIDVMNHGAEIYGWKTDVIEGNSSLVDELLSGNWQSPRFLVVQPSKTIQPSFDDATIVVER